MIVEMETATAIFTEPSNTKEPAISLDEMCPLVKKWVEEATTNNRNRVTSECALMAIHLAVLE